MKKRLALLLAIVMMLSSFSFAATNYEDYGLELKELGVIKGDENGNLNATEKLTREQAIVTLVRMMGMEKKALDCVADSPFSDAPADHWAKQYVTFANKKGWTNGIGDDLFGVGTDVTMQQYLTFMLRALNYTGDDVYAKAAEMAEQMKLLNDVKATDQKEALLRSDVFVIMYNTLYAMPKDSTVNLGGQLGILPTHTAEASPITETVYPLEIENYNGEKLVIDKKPMHVVSLKLGLDELLLGLAETDRVAGLSGQIGNSKSVSLAAEHAANFPKMEDNFEVILAQNPDLILGSSWIKKELLAQIADNNIPYYGYKSPNTIEEQIQVIRNFATVLGARLKGEEIIADWNARLAVIDEKAATIKDEDKLMVLPYNMHGKTNAKGTIIDEIIYRVGAKNAATEAGIEKRAKISKEKIIELDPDVILMTAWGMDDLDEFNKYVEDMKNDPALQGLKAIKNNRVIVEDGRYMTIVTQHLINGIEFVAENVYPEVYGK